MQPLEPVQLLVQERLFEQEPVQEFDTPPTSSTSTSYDFPFTEILNFLI